MKLAFSVQRVHTSNRHINCSGIIYEAERQMVMLTHVFSLHRAFRLTSLRTATFFFFFHSLLPSSCMQASVQADAVIFRILCISYCAFGIFLIEICIFGGKAARLRRGLQPCIFSFSMQLQHSKESAIANKCAQSEHWTNQNECRVQSSAFAHFAVAVIWSTRAIYMYEDWSI